tara:strand:+ start:1021 stop:2163 length:1143 start_codon:yes stop_codon:yes gene_type:complete
MSKKIKDTLGGNMEVKFSDLGRVNAEFQSDFLKQVTEVLDSGSFINGEKVDIFEKQFANYCEVDFCVGVGNGLDALRLTLEAWQLLGIVDRGDEVIVPANTFIASVLAITAANLKPVLVDIDPNTMLMNLEDVEAKISSKTSVIMPVHLYGRAQDLGSLKRLQNSYNFKILEDAAQAHGAKIDGMKVGSLGDAAGFSFYPGKNLGALGDGGAVVTNDKDLAEIVRKLANYGSDKKYEHALKGCNSRLDELQAGFLSCKLPKLDAYNSLRVKIAEKYYREIRNPNIRLLTKPFDGTHVFHLFVVEVINRSAFQSFMTKNGIETLIHYPKCIHEQICYKELKNIDTELAERSAKAIVSLPIHPFMSDSEIEAVVIACNKYAP